MTTDSISDILYALGVYRVARSDFLRLLGCHTSNRDPLAEFSERLAEAWLRGTLASSRVQRGYDLIDGDGRRVQVKYLANPPGTWVNGHEVRFTSEVDAYVVVMIEALDFAGAVCFARTTIPEVSRRLGKRHPNQETTLQITQANWRSIVASRSAFDSIGVAVLLPSDVGMPLQS